MILYDMRMYGRDYLTDFFKKAFCLSAHLVKCNTELS